MKILKTKRTLRNAGIVSTAEQKSLVALYRKGPSAYGSIHNLSNASNLSRRKVETFLHPKNAHTKYRQSRCHFPCLEVCAYDIDEIWSIDLAYLDRLAKYNKGVKYLLVAVDVLSRKLRVEPMRSKTAEETTKTFARMTSMTKPKKVWSDKGTDFRGAFKDFCNRNGIETYITRSEAKSAFAERNNRSLKNIIYKHLKNIWSSRYINELQSFVRTINSRVNGKTGMAPTKVSQKHVKRLLPITAESNKKIKKKNPAWGATPLRKYIQCWIEWYQPPTCIFIIRGEIYKTIFVFFFQIFSFFFPKIIKKSRKNEKPSVWGYTP